MQVDQALFSAFADYLRPDNTLTWRVWKRKDKKSKDKSKQEKENARGGANDSEARSEDKEDKEAVVAAATVRGEGKQPLLEERWCVFVCTIERERGGGRATACVVGG